MTMEYWDVFKDRSIPSEIIKGELNRISIFLREFDEDKVQRFVMDAYARINGRHFDEPTAKKAICDMRPSIRGGGSLSVAESMDMLGINADTASEGISKAYARALDINSEAPKVSDKVTKWDRFVAVAMAVSDYWMFDLEGQFDVAYQFLSDVDAPDTKMWDYING